MNVWDILILLAVGGLLFLAWRRSRKKDGCCDCACCAARNECEKKKP